MYKIGEFSSMAKTTIKTLRYYEKEKLLKPCYIDPNTSYRYYEASQLVELSRIIALRQIGVSISDIRKIIKGFDINVILNNKKEELEKHIGEYIVALSKINYLLEENMKSDVFMKEVPAYTIYYCDGIIEDFSKISEFVLMAGTKCAKDNHNLKCVNPDYCYVSYLDGEYKEHNIKIRYAQAVETMGNETDDIKFMKTSPVTCACIYHKGAYENLRDSYNTILKYIEANGYEIIDNARECYIDGCWNKASVDDYLTEIEFPVRKK